jgi:basic membrane protein A
MVGKVRTAFSLLAVAIMVAACSSSNNTTAPSGSSLKIGVVTDVGTIDGQELQPVLVRRRREGRAKTSARTLRPVHRPEGRVGVRKRHLRQFVEQNYNIIVTVGFNLAADTTKAAKANPNVWFVGVTSRRSAWTRRALDTTFACKGDAATLLPKLHLASSSRRIRPVISPGSSPPSVSKTGNGRRRSAESTTTRPVVRYMQGFQLGAKSVGANIVVKTAYVDRQRLRQGVRRPGWGKTFATQFIKTNKVDVLFQVAGKTGNGILDAACAAKIAGIGVDVDQYLSYPAADACIVTSAEKHLSNAVEAALKGIADGSAKAGNILFNAANDGIGVSDFHGVTVPADLQGKLDAALAAMKAGTLTTCPVKCGTP